jgi:hypothetical protein
LILYARQLGWFHSIPETAKKDKITRAQKIESNGGRPLMPDVAGGEYLVAYWLELGKCSSGAMGPVPLAPADVQAWQRGTRVDLLPFEFTALLEMSRGYVSGLLEGEKADCPPPFGDKAQEFDREAVGKKISNAFKAFIAARKT